MKQTMTNAEIEGCLKILNAQNSFRGNVNVKLPAKVDWAIRVNIKAMNSVFELYNEARSEIGKRYVDSGKTEGDQVKDEYLNEFVAEMQELATQENEVAIRTLSIEDVYTIEGLSSVERDALIMMCNAEDVDKYFSVDDEEPENEEIKEEA